MLEADSISISCSSRAILSGCYISCAAGQITGLLGRNGSGKSTLLKIIFGSVKADFKHLRINGKIINKAYKTGLVAYLPQHPFLPYQLKTNAILKGFDTIAYLNIAAEIRESLRDKKVADLSGGELRILELIWLLKLRTPYLLLDEPFSGLSPIWIEAMQLLIAEAAAANRGIILTDHLYKALLGVSHKIVLLHNNAVYPIRTEDDLARYGYIPLPAN